MSAALRTAARGWLGDEDKATLVPPSATLDENPVAAGLEASGLQKTHEPGWSGEWYGIVPDRGRYASFPNPVRRGICWLPHEEPDKHRGSVAVTFSPFRSPG